MSSYSNKHFGTIYYYKTGAIPSCYHREDGPAIIRPNGAMWWYIDGKLHRLDGPAIIYSNGDKLWYWNNILVDCQDQETFERMIKLKAFW